MRSLSGESGALDATARPTWFRYGRHTELSIELAGVSRYLATPAAAKQ